MATDSFPLAGAQGPERVARSAVGTGVGALVAVGVGVVARVAGEEIPADGAPQPAISRAARGMRVRRMAALGRGAGRAFGAWGERMGEPTFHFLALGCQGKLGAVTRPTPCMTHEGMHWSVKWVTVAPDPSQMEQLYISSHSP